MTTVETPRVGTEPYPDEELDLDLRWWATADHLTGAPSYRLANALLREPLRQEHVKPRLLGHRGTSPGLTMVHTLLNRMSRYDPVLEALRRSRRVTEGGDGLARLCRDRLRRHGEHVVEALEDLPEVGDWTWRDGSR